MILKGQLVRITADVSGLPVDSIAEIRSVSKRHYKDDEITVNARYIYSNNYVPNDIKEIDLSYSIPSSCQPLNEFEVKALEPLLKEKL